MSTLRLFAPAVTIILAATSVAFAAERSQADAAAAISADESTSSAAVERLRNRGSEGLNELFALRDEIVGGATNAEVDLTRLDSAIDRVGGARYCSTSRLFWHTDLDRAKAEAKEAGKPILSLRMMGNLTDEFSCANSRFFRTTLYANEEISTLLREKYVLHWKSVRPVPKVTIDFGDGRKLERTLTGNSIHYVLDSDGEVLDGLPGLYSPAKFVAWLNEMHPLAINYAAAKSKNAIEELRAYLNQWHTRKADEINKAWQADLQKVAAMKTAAEERLAGEFPPAEKAAALAIPKSFIEFAVIATVTMRGKQLETQTSDETWESIAALHDGETKLDDASVRVIRSENPTAAEATRLAIGKGRVEDPVLKMVRQFESSITLDTVRNEYTLHRRLHEWFGNGDANTDVDTLNEKVYADLFLTPSSDPWIGLVPKDIYTGLDNAGVKSEE